MFIIMHLVTRGTFNLIATSTCEKYHAVSFCVCLGVKSRILCRVIDYRNRMII